MRLAFAVAAHLDPEILIVDEVLAVGDATYQKRCIERMTTLARSGKTILFVSHNMDFIPLLCSRALLLESGRLVADGPAPEMVNRYVGAQLTDGATDDLGCVGHTGDGRARYTRLALVDGTGRRVLSHARGDDLRLRVCIEAAEPIGDAALSIVLSTLSGARVITSWTREIGLRVDLRPGDQWFECCFRDVRLRPGHAVNVSLWMEAHSVVDSVANAGIVHVTPDGDSTFSTDGNQGIIALDYTWTPCDRPAQS